MNNSFNKIAKKVRKQIILISHKAKSSHIGSCLSIVDIIVVLYKSILKKNIFILSKGHAGLAIYCLLAEIGKMKKEILLTYGKDKTSLMQHVSHKVKGVKFSTGSLGHGLPVATGIALADKLNRKKNITYVLISDGELNEGTTWESLLFASHHKLDNLCVIIDYNKLQSLTFTSKTLNIEPLREKIKSFGCFPVLTNGHNFKQIYKSLKIIKKNKPKVIIASTIKGKGVSFMENKILWHYRSPNNFETHKALMEINNA